MVPDEHALRQSRLLEQLDEHGFGDPLTLALLAGGAVVLASWARWRMSRVTSTESFTGRVFGIDADHGPRPVVWHDGTLYVPSMFAARKTWPKPPVMRFGETVVSLTCCTSRPARRSSWSESDTIGDSCKRSAICAGVPTTL